MKENQINQTESKRRGGKRDGAGRPSFAAQVRKDPRWLEARGVNPLAAAEILSHVVNERKVWHRILSTEDDRVLLQAMMFLTSMRDGKPAQSINVTSQSINVQLKDIDAARAIIREIRGERTPQLAQSNSVEGELIPALDKGEVSAEDVREGEGIALSNSEEKSNGTMLSGAEGGEKGGRE